MPETNGVALGRGTPSAYPEPMSSEPPNAEATMCVDPSSSSAPAAGDVTGAGGSSAGAEELVRRFGGSEGAGTTLDPQPMPEDESSCGDEALRALAACAQAVRSAPPKGPIDAVISAIACAGSFGGYIECLANEAAEKGGVKP
jgi:hypothetical protein